MFDTKTVIADRIADTVDLMIDFATLGEYGLEPVGRTSPGCQQGRRRQGAHRAPPRRLVDRGTALGR